jgi:ABC-type polysaccharide/polyol phosphate export permease
MAISVPIGAKSNRIPPLDDIINGARKWELWGKLGWLEVKRRYRRTVIGPFWSTISLGIYLTALGAVGAGLWKQNIAEYVPFLAAGMIVWIMFSTILTEAGTLFLSAAHLFKELRFEYSILVYAAVWRNLIVFLHNLIAFVVVIAILAPHRITFDTLLVIPGLAIVILNALWVTLFFGMLCLRYRDVQQFIMSIIQVPALRHPDLLASRGAERIRTLGLHWVQPHLPHHRGRAPALARRSAISSVLRRRHPRHCRRAGLHPCGIRSFPSPHRVLGLRS